MGHASRCVPIIKNLCENNKVILGISPLNAGFFEMHFPQLQKVQLPSYNIRYSKYLPAFFKLLLQVPRVYRVVQKERIQLQRLIRQHAIDLVISDSRLGCYSKQVKSIFITHQLNLKVPYLTKLANAIHQKWMRHFTEVWVPDFENPAQRLSGQLSDPSNVQVPVFFIGPLSALQQQGVQTNTSRIDTLILLSGVEPQRSVLEKKLIHAFKASSQRIVLVRGTEKKMEVEAKGMEVHNLAFGKTLSELISNAGRVICRSGYSTLMDLHRLEKKKLVLIPTPGQSEQEYLAAYWAQKFQARVYAQSEITNEGF